MASTDDALETYTQLPLHVDPASKQISTTSTDKTLQDALTALNALCTSLKSLGTTNNIPPPPVPVNPKRSAQIAKLRDTAQVAHRKGQYSESVRLWSYAIDMAAGRPSWEPTSLIREELAMLYAGRANSHMGAQNWVEGWKDAECSTECKRGSATAPNGQVIPGNAKAFVLGGRCLIELGRWSEAVAWLERGTEIEGKEGEDGKELVRLLDEARKRSEKESFWA